MTLKNGNKVKEGIYFAEKSSTCQVHTSASHGMAVGGLTPIPHDFIFGPAKKFSPPASAVLLFITKKPFFDEESDLKASFYKANHAD